MREGADDICLCPNDTNEAGNDTWANDIADFMFVPPGVL